MTLRETMVFTDDFMGIYEKFSTTTARWKSYWFDAFCEVYENCKKEIDKVFKICRDTMEIIFKKVRKTYSYDIQLEADVSEDLFLDKNKEKVYLFRFFDKDNQLVCSKVGTTTRTVKQRLREELRSKTYTNMGCTSAVIDRIYDCGKLPAEGLESRLRAEYIKVYPESFKKNDRFIAKEFDLNTCDKIVTEYLK